MAGTSTAFDSLASGRRLWVVLVVLLALSIRAWVAIDQEILFNDGPEFLAVAQYLADGNFRAALANPYHPLTAILIALTSKLGGVGLESAGVIVSVLSGGVATAALYLLVRALFGTSLALLAALFFAVHPQLVEVASNVQSDGIHLALFLLGALLAWRALESKRFAHALGAGILCGLAYLTRPEGLAIGVVLGGWILVDLVRRRINGRQLASLVGGFATTLLVFGGPYLVAMHAVKGEWVLSQKKRVIPVEWSLPEPQRVVESLADVGASGVGAFRVAFLVLALLAFRRRRPSRPTLYLLSYVCLLALVLIGLQLQSGYVSGRHWLTAVALAMPFVAMGALRLASWLKHALPPLRMRPWAVPVSIAVLLAAFIVYDLRPRTEPVKRARKQAAEWLRALEPSAVAAPRLRVAYYAGAARYISLSQAPERDAFSAWLRSQGAEFVIAEEERLPPRPPDGHPGLRELHRVEYPGGSVAVLRVEQEPGP